MSPAMAARWAYVCALICTALWGGGRTARAERRPVAVVNLDLSDTSPAAGLAEDINRALYEHPELNQLPNGTNLAALKDPISDPDRPGLATARQFLQRAEQRLSAFQYGLAISDADDGERALLTVAPAAAQLIYADLALVRAQAQLADGHPEDALTWFALVAQLDPKRELDPARYLPEVVEAFAKAKAQKPPPGSITVDGHGRVWIDAVEVGQSNGGAGFSVPAGRHVVWLTGPERETSGAQVVVAPNKAAPVSIPDVPLEPGRPAQRARIALARAWVDATSRAAAMNNLAKLVGVSDAVLLHVSTDPQSGKSTIVVQTWRGGDSDHPGFSSLREHAKEPAIDLLSPLAPPKKVEKPVEPPFVPLKPVVVKRWYEKRSWQVGLIATGVAVLVGGYFLTTLGPNTFLVNGDLGVMNVGSTVAK